MVEKLLDTYLNPPNFVTEFWVGLTITVIVVLAWIVYAKTAGLDSGYGSNSSSVMGYGNTAGILASFGMIISGTVGLSVLNQDTREAGGQARELILDQTQQNGFVTTLGDLDKNTLQALANNRLVIVEGYDTGGTKTTIKLSLDDAGNIQAARGVQVDTNKP